MSREKKLIFETLLLAVAFSGVVICDDTFGMRLTTEGFKNKASTQYRFHYFVKDEKTGDYKAQEETKRGDSVQGSYTIADPNGDLRTVTYKAGPGTGFEAKVNVQPSGSPMKLTTEGTTARSDDFKTSTTLETKVKTFPGGFAMNLTSPQSDVLTEMGMKFSLKANPVTEPITDSLNTFTTQVIKTTEAVRETTNTTPSISTRGTENSTLTEARDISEDPIEKEIDEAINSMPKLPELVLSDNKTHFKFHKDPEEALLDERITQIARQLAETSLRREYEERKLGHFIPISLSSLEPSTTGYIPRSFNLPADEGLTSSEPSTVQVFTQLRMVPEYVYKQTLLPRISPLSYRLPVMGKPSPQTEEPITEDIPKVGKTQTKDFSTIFKVTENYNANPPTSLMPLQVPTFFQFFSPYVMHTSRGYLPEQKLEPTTVKKDLTKGETELDNDTTVYSDVIPVTKRTPNAGENP